MTDAEKALNLLIHDLRAPLSVAHGYLRLLKEHRLSSDAERERAIDQSIDALGRLSRLCLDASAFTDSSIAAPPLSTIGAADLVARVGALFGSDGAHVQFDPLDGTVRVRVTSADRTAEALVVIIGAARRQRPAADALSLKVHNVDDELRFLFGTDEEQSALCRHAGAALDPWHGGHGLQLPLACQTVTRSGGRIWVLDGVRGAVGVALPIEVRPA